MNDKELKEWEKEAKEVDITLNQIAIIIFISGIVGTFLYVCEIYG